MAGDLGLLASLLRWIEQQTPALSIEERLTLGDAASALERAALLEAALREIERHAAPPFSSASAARLSTIHDTARAAIKEDV